QARAAADRFRREERFDDPLAQVHWNTGSRIFDGNFIAAPTVARENANCPLSGNGVYGIGYEVHDRLTDQARVATDDVWLLDVGARSDAFAKAMLLNRQHRVHAFLHADRFVFALV